MYLGFQCQDKKVKPMKTLISDALKSKFSLFISSEKDYIEYLSSVVKEISKEKPSICYVCLARPYMEVVKDLKEGGVDITGFFFIDAVTSQNQGIPPTENCLFLGNSRVETIEKALLGRTGENENSIIIFDTVSALLMYEKKADIIKFTFNLLSRKLSSTNIYFIIKDLGVKTEDNKTLLEDLRMFADAQVEAK